MHTSYVFAIPMKEMSAENAVQAYLSGLFTHKGGSIAILNVNGTEFKNTVLNEACEQLVIKRLFSNMFQPKPTKELHNFPKRTLIKFLGSSD